VEFWIWGARGGKSLLSSGLGHAPKFCISKVRGNICVRENLSWKFFMVSKGRVSPVLVDTVLIKTLPYHAGTSRGLG
jgi:hypothetical protein